MTQSIQKSKNHFQFPGIPTHLSNDEKLLLYNLSTSLPENACIVEIGSYLGASTYCLASGVTSYGGKVYAIDTWTNIGMSEGERNTFDKFQSNIAPLREVVIPLKGFSKAHAISFDKQIDLLFIDGDHSYEGVKTDLELWLPKVKPGGWVVMHDFGWAEGVKRCVREYLLPVQIETGHTLDQMYYTRIDNSVRNRTYQKKATVIMPTNRPIKDIEETIESICQQVIEPYIFEFIVIDNLPNRDIKHQLTEKITQLNKDIYFRYQHESTPGLLSGRHRGMQVAQAEILVFIDDDIIADKNWLSAIIETFDDPNVHLVGGRNLPKYETNPPPWLDQFWSEIEDGRLCGYLSVLDFGDQQKEIDPNYVWGLNFAIRKQTLIALGGFHPDGMPWHLRHFRGDGESGLTAKATQMGIKAVYQPRAKIYHKVSKERLTIDYFKQRAHLQGISDSYSFIRRHHGIQTSMPYFVKKYVKMHVIQFKNLFGYYELKIKKNYPKYVHNAYLAGYEYHQRQAIKNKKVLNWILKENYWDYTLPE